MGLGMGFEDQCICSVDQDVKLSASTPAECQHVCHHAPSMMIMD